MKQKLLQAAAVEVVQDAVLSVIRRKIKTRPAEVDVYCLGLWLRTKHLIHFSVQLR